MYNLNPIDYWKEKIRDLYFSLPEEARRYCMADMDLKDYEVKKILNLLWVDKRLEQKKETWIKNVMRIQDISREKAEELYEKIKPYGRLAQ